MQVFARSFESLATDSTALRFPAPLADRAPDPAGFEFWWKMLEFVFQLPDPSSFPKLSVLPLGPELAVLRRYIAAAEDTAGSALLSGGDAFTVRVSDDGAGIEHTDATFTGNESRAGSRPYSGNSTPRRRRPALIKSSASCDRRTVPRLMRARQGA